jgi:DNA-binding NarL/FixJ family response regulator
MPKPLSSREREVCGLVAQGKANKQVAFELGLRENTVKVYLCSIFKKLNVGNRTELAIKWPFHVIP